MFVGRNDVKYYALDSFDMASTDCDPHAALSFDVEKEVVTYFLFLLAGIKFGVSA